MSNGSEELAHLAHLLRVGARAARQIASLRTTNSDQIDDLASQIEHIAQDLDTISSADTSEQFSDQMVQSAVADVAARKLI